MHSRGEWWQRRGMVGREGTGPKRPGEGTLCSEKMRGSFCYHSQSGWVIKSKEQTKKKKKKCGFSKMEVFFFSPTKESWGWKSFRVGRMTVWTSRAQAPSTNIVASIIQSKMAARVPAITPTFCLTYGRNEGCILYHLRMRPIICTRHVCLHSICQCWVKETFLTSRQAGKCSGPVFHVKTKCVLSF